MMSKLRALATLITAAIGLTSAFAQFNGPAPLSWRWQQPTTASPSGSPAIDGDVVYVASGQRMYALNRADGNQKWRYPLATINEPNFKGTPALGGGLVIAAAENRTLYAVNANTGERAWTYIAPATIIGSPQVYKDLVLFQMADGIMAVTLSTGLPFYQTPIFLRDGIQGGFSISRDNVLVFSALHTLYAINIGSQRVAWHQDTAGVGLDAFAVTDSTSIYFVSNNYLIGLDAGDGKMLFSTPADEGLVLAPAVSSKYIMAMTRDGKAYFFKHATLPRDAGKRITNENGKTLPPIELKSSPLLRPTAIDGDLFVVATTAGTIELIDPSKIDAKDPQAGITWNYPIRPIGGTQEVENTTNTGAGPGGRSGGAAGPGGLPGGAGGQGQGPNFGRGGPNSNVTRIVTIQASGPAILDKTTLLVLGRDGSLLAFDKETGVDLTAPKVTMTYPNAGDVVSSKPPLALVFKLEDEASGVNEGTLKITVDNREVDFTLNKEGVAIVHCSNTGKNHLTDGKKKIVVEVSDWMGNTRQAEFSLSIDNELPPVQAVTDTTQPGLPGKGGRVGGGGGGQAGASG